MGRIRDDVSRVTVSSPVNGLPRRQQSTKARTRQPTMRAAQVPDALLRAAQAAMRPGERIVIESPTCIRLVYR